MLIEEVSCRVRAARLIVGRSVCWVGPRKYRLVPEVSSVQSRCLLQVAEIRLACNPTRSQCTNVYRMDLTINNGESCLEKAEQKSPERHLGAFWDRSEVGFVEDIKLINNLNINSYVFIL